MDREGLTGFIMAPFSNSSAQFRRKWSIFDVAKINDNTEIERLYLLVL